LTTTTTMSLSKFQVFENGHNCVRKLFESDAERE